jgi:hypothetical protein
MEGHQVSSDEHTTHLLTERSSSRARRVKGSVGNLRFTSLIRARDALTFRLYWFSTARRNTVVRCSVSRGCTLRGMVKTLEG